MAGVAGCIEAVSAGETDFVCYINIQAVRDGDSNWLVFLADASFVGETSQTCLAVSIGGGLLTVSWQSSAQPACRKVEVRGALQAGGGDDISTVGVLEEA